MTQLPDGWRALTLADVARWGSGGTPTAGRSDYYGGTIPWAVIGDLNDGKVRVTRSSITTKGLAESSAKLVPEDAVLVAMYGSIGKLGLTSTRMATNQAIAFAEAGDAIESRYLFHYLASQRHELNSAGKGATQKNISQTLLKTWPIPVPPVTEQRRIVDILDDHLSRLDAATAGLDAGRRRARVLTKSIIFELIPEVDTYPDAWRLSSVGDAGRVELGRQRHPDWHNGDTMRPYLRVANVFEDRIDVRDVKEMHWPAATFERFRLQQGDILLNEGQSPEWLGRPAMYRGELGEVAFTNSLIRFTAHAEVLPEFALLVFRRHMHAGRFMRESRVTTNIAHLSASRLKSVEFPVPPLPEQQRLVTAAAERLAAVPRLLVEIDAGQKRLAGLRRSLLGAAFSGRLTGHSSDLDRAEELMT